MEDDYNKNNIPPGSLNDNQRDYDDRPDSFGRPGSYGYAPFPPEPEMTVKDWLITLLVLTIPCVNIIMLFIWAFSADGNATRRNFCRAQLIFMAIMIAISIVLSGIIGSFLALTLSNMGYYF